MHLKRSVLVLVSLLVSVYLGLVLLSSVSQPQVQDRLQLSQTALILQASEWQPPADSSSGAFMPTMIQQMLLRGSPYDQALSQYEEVRQSAERQLKILGNEPSLAQGRSTARRSTETTAPRLQSLVANLQLEEGLLDVAANRPAAARQRWEVLSPGDLSPGDLSPGDLSPGDLSPGEWRNRVAQETESSRAISVRRTAQTLQGLWSDPPRLLPEAETTLQQNLKGWFRDRALLRLYTLQERPTALQSLQASIQDRAAGAVVKLSIVALIPLLGFGVGTLLLLRGGIQALRRRGKSTPVSPSTSSSPTSSSPTASSPTALPLEPAGSKPTDAGLARALPEGAGLVSPGSASPGPAPSGPIPGPATPGLPGSPGGLFVVNWPVAWTWETVALALFGGFFLIGQLLVSQSVGVVLAALLRGVGSPAQALSILLGYAAMALSVLGVLYLCLRPYFPLARGWFQFRGPWVGWGVAGYFMATPLVLLVSLVNQQFWHGQGGSNPLLTLALENGDRWTLVCFFVTAAIAAPAFEELFFRGFLLPSLRRYTGTWGAIALSAIIFAAAHLNPSEIPPLTILGMVLGYVYCRSGNLLAPMLLHSLWNGSTLLNLFLLGSALR